MNLEEALKENNNLKAFLVELLECGYNDVNYLLWLFKLKEFVGVEEEISELMEDLGFNKIDYGAVAYSIMRAVVDKLAADIERHYNDEKAADELRDKEIFVNYLDSHFNIEALDGFEDFNASYGTLLKAVYEEVKA